jgi:hypothetical protein
VTWALHWGFGFVSNEPHSPWSPVGVRGPARTLGFLPRSVRVGAAGSALDNRPMGFQSLLGAQLRPPSPTLSSISGALVPARRGTGNEALARTSKVPPSTLFSRVTRGRRARALAEPSGAACAGVSPPPPPESPRLVPVTSASASSPANSFSLESPDSWNDVVRRGERFPSFDLLFLPQFTRFEVPVKIHPPTRLHRERTPTGGRCGARTAARIAVPARLVGLASTQARRRCRSACIADNVGSTHARTRRRRCAGTSFATGVSRRPSCAGRSAPCALRRRCCIVFSV